MDSLRKLVSGLFSVNSDAYPDRLPAAHPTSTATPVRVTRKVLMITHNPKLRTQGGRTLRDYFGWNEPDALAKGYRDDLLECSDGYANFEIVERLVVDGFP